MPISFRSVNSANKRTRTAGYESTASIDSQTGALLVSNPTSRRRTYTAAFSVVLAASATDVVEVVGSATTRVEITKVIISGTQGTAGQAIIDLIRRSAADTGGTSTNATLAKHEVSDAAATAVVKVYTANPTVGATAGTVRRVRTQIGSATVGGAPLVLDFGSSGKPIVLVGATQTLAINLAGATLATGTLDVTIEFTEVTN